MIPVIHRGWPEIGFFWRALRAGHEAPLLPAVPDNGRPETPYLCLVPLGSVQRLDPQNNVFPAIPPWQGGLEPEVLTDLRAGRALLVLDLSNEGPAMIASLFAHLHATIDALAIPPRQVVWMSGNRALPLAYARHFARHRAAPIRFLEYNHFVKMMLFVFAAPWSAARGADGAPDEAGLVDGAARDRLLLCLNATPRLHRVLAVAALLQLGLIQDSLVSFGGFAYAKDPITPEAALAFVARHAYLQPLRPAVERLVGMGPLRVDAFDETGNALWDRISPDAYRRSFLSLVTESDFFDEGVHWVTEKTVKAYAMGHPTLVLGPAGAGGFMTELGFAPWDAVIDPNAERAAAPRRRFRAVIDEAHRQAALVRENPAAWLARTRETARFNLRHGDGPALAAYQARFDRPLVAQLEAWLAGREEAVAPHLTGGIRW